MTPKISSMMAAPKIALPARVFNFPSSFNVSTVILTDVAVRIIPIKIFCNSGAAVASEIPPLLNIEARANPPARGIIIPRIAITIEAFPVFFNSLISVSSPAVNIKTITPSSATWRIKSVSCKMFKQAGPSNNPANKAPTTCGN